MSFATKADRDAVENEMPWVERDVPKTMYEFINSVAQRHGQRPDNGGVPCRQGHAVGDL